VKILALKIESFSNLQISVRHRIEFPVKKEGFGGGGTKISKFVQGVGEIAQLKISGKTMTVAIGPGLAKNSSKILTSL